MPTEAKSKRKKSVDPEVESEALDVVAKNTVVDDDPEEVTEASVVEDVKEEQPKKSKEEEAVEILDSHTDPVRWIIGKGPELGGNENTYSVYYQRKLGYMPRIKFFAMVTKTIGSAIKAGGVVNLGDAFDMEEGGSLRERASKLTNQDFADAGSFMALAMELMSHSEDFLVNCYIMWLDVPKDERNWAKQVLSQSWDPDNGRYGLKDEDGIKMIEVFIDQNYEDIRRFFVKEIPKLGKRFATRERELTEGRE